MMFAAPFPGSSERVTADVPGDGYCPGCDQKLRRKCGSIVTPHWAHFSADCDPWYSPETEWHLDWKRDFGYQGADIEVRRGPHRADVVTAAGTVIELQSRYLSPEDIAARESFYGRNLVWIYRADPWQDRICATRNPEVFQWERPAVSMTRHACAVWWHIGDELVEVELWTKEYDVEVYENEDGQGCEEYKERVYGREVRRYPVDSVEINLALDGVLKPEPRSKPKPKAEPKVEGSDGLGNGRRLLQRLGAS